MYPLEISQVSPAVQEPQVWVLRVAYSFLSKLVTALNSSCVGKTKHIAKQLTDTERCKGQKQSPTSSAAIICYLVPFGHKSHSTKSSSLVPPSLSVCVPLLQCSLLLCVLPSPSGRQSNHCHERSDTQKNNWRTGTVWSVSLRRIMITRGRAECQSLVDRWAWQIQPRV